LYGKQAEQQPSLDGLEHCSSSDQPFIAKRFKDVAADYPCGAQTRWKEGRNSEQLHLLP